MKVVVATPPPPGGYYLASIFFSGKTAFARIADAPAPGGTSVPGLEGYSFFHPDVSAGGVPMTLGQSSVDVNGTKYVIVSGLEEWYGAYGSESIDLSVPLTLDV